MSVLTIAPMPFASDRDAAPRKAEGFEAVGQQPGPSEETASPEAQIRQARILHALFGDRISQGEA